MQNTLVIVRGLPSSGKTAFSSMLMGLVGWDSAKWSQYKTPCAMFAADDFFENRPFNPRQLGIAHGQCQHNVSYAMTEGVPLVVVHNTSIKWSDYKAYVKLAIDNNYRYFVISLFDGGCTDDELVDRNQHNVPTETIARYRRTFQHEHGPHLRRMQGKPEPAPSGKACGCKARR